jgi:hypothetical protein
MAIGGLGELKEEPGDDEHVHVYSQWMNYQDRPKPATEYRVCQVFLPSGVRCPHFELRNKTVA